MQAEVTLSEAAIASERSVRGIRRTEGRTVVGGVNGFGPALI